MISSDVVSVVPTGAMTVAKSKVVDVEELVVGNLRDEHSCLTPMDRAVLYRAGRNEFSRLTDTPSGSLMSSRSALL